MTNPWLKKNPLMSMWLSSFNTVANTVRAHAVQQAKRETSTAMNRATKDFINVWMAGWAHPPKKTKRKRR